jgi:undecaprenyl diphosphate synthase
LEVGDVDLVIRTTPQRLLSGFLPLQSQYAQLVFLTTPLNDLDVRDIDDLIADYRRSPQLRGL